ncbi:MAG: adenylate/guanylate cyclase domain-containing protein [Thermoleophilia bacterium]|nr:adenylate/guanylate cyclase domain-containing protein [Thermoleophilia bacterium]
MNADRWERLPPPLLRVADIGSAEGDSEQVRLRKRVLNLAAVFMAALSPVWIVTYLLLGLWVSAAIPLGFLLATPVLLWVYSRNPIYRWFRSAELAMMLVLPFALQWSLGGFANSSMVALWALTSPLGAVFFIGARRATPWLAAFAVLAVFSGLIDPVLSESAPEIPEAVIVTFFVLNLLAVAATVFLLVQYSVRAREAEHDRSERLLLNVLPESVAHRLKHSDGVIADAYPEATVLFADIVDFTPLSEGMEPGDVVALLDRVFTGWDRLAAAHGLEKIKTIGDEYMVVGGVPDPRPDHTRAIAGMALEMSAELEKCSADGAAPLRARIGIDTGPVVAGVIGRSKFIYDLWGDTVNTASRMESSGEPGRIQVTERTRERLGNGYRLRPRGEIEVKGKGLMTTYFLEGAAARGSGEAPRN